MNAVERIDALLPQTQCARCGYPSCRDYAQALAAGETDLNRCPPGGTLTIEALAKMLGRGARPLDPACGAERPWCVARIDETACIGCTLCIQACPVDAILGASKRMHTVIESECTGCELCLEPCPVECITLAPMEIPTAGNHVGSGNDAATKIDFLERWMRERAPLARRRYRDRQLRLWRAREKRAEKRRQRAGLPGRNADRAEKQAIIRAAVERARQRRRGRSLM